MYYDAKFRIKMNYIETVTTKNIAENLERLLLSVESLLQVFITVHDCRGLLRDKNGNPLLPGRNLHQHPYCTYGRYSQPGWNGKCVNDCFKRTESIAARELQPFIKSCWKGTSELVVPVAREKTHVLTLFVGVFRKENQLPDASLSEKLLKMYRDLPIINDKKILECNRMLLFLGQGIIHYLNSYHKVNEEPANRTDIIKRYIHYNAHRNDLKLQNLAKHLSLSPSRTSHLVSLRLGRSFSDQVNRERMLRARALLISSTNSLEEISSAVGISGVYYFNRVFKAFFGIPPGAFRLKYAEHAYTKNRLMKY